MDYWDMERLAQQSAEAANMLRALGDQQRLLILCHLSADAEMSAAALQARMVLSQSALSEQLGRLHEDGLVALRGEPQSEVYRVADERISRLLGLLHELYCPDLPSGAQPQAS